MEFPLLCGGQQVKGGERQEMKPDTPTTGLFNPYKTLGSSGYAETLPFAEQ